MYSFIKIIIANEGVQLWGGNLYIWMIIIVSQYLRVYIFISLVIIMTKYRIE